MFGRAFLPNISFFVSVYMQASLAVISTTRLATYFIENY